MYTQKAKFASLHASLDFARDERGKWHSESLNRKRDWTSYPQLLPPIPGANN
jgi:hypothetical protein